MMSADIRERASLRVGQTLRGKWRIDRLIGVGGMAAVYAATHRNGKRGAVKLLHPEMSLNDEVRSRFLREGYVANKVDHPGVVSVLDDDTNDDGAVFLVMELLEGESIDGRMARYPNGRMPEADAVPIIVDMLDVLAAAHERGVVHRDLKPDNVFITTRGQIKVLDFGIARLREAAQQSGTQTGSLMGTPNFMPPEQALGDWQKVDGRTDLWATGATLFAMLSGRPVHLGDSPNKILLAAMTQAAPPLASVSPGVSPWLASVVDKALAFDRDRRWPNALEMRDALRAHGSGAAATTTSMRPAEGPAYASPTPMPAHRTVALPSSPGPYGSEPPMASARPITGAPAFANQPTTGQGASLVVDPLRAPSAPPPLVSIPPRRAVALWLAIGATVIAAGVVIVLAALGTHEKPVAAARGTASGSTNGSASTSASASTSTSASTGTSTSAGAATVDVSAEAEPVNGSAAAPSASAQATRVRTRLEHRPAPPAPPSPPPPPRATSIFEGGRR